MSKPKVCIDLVCDVISPLCRVGKRNLEIAMRERPDLEFAVRLYPFQLSPELPPQMSKVEAYMRRYGYTKEECLEKGEIMRQLFEAAGLPYKVDEANLTGNTFDAHRLLTVAYEGGGAAAQDKAAESLFNSYFAEGRSPSDPAVLQLAAHAAGLDGTTFIAEPSVGAAQTKAALGMARNSKVTGVPFFVIYEEGSANKVEAGGAQPPEQFLALLNQVVRA
jgi:predicted DsbA family dithiol-disulfide isomerase